MIIVGGGPSGLIAAWQLRQTHFLLLEKEPRLGGSAISEQWRGVWYSTGAAYQMYKPLEKLCGEIGSRFTAYAAWMPPSSTTASCRIFGWKSPYPESVNRA